MPKSDIGRQNNEAIGCYFTFVRESLKFMIFSFFKRCRLIIKILIQYFENKEQASDHDGRHRRRSRQRETRESILADMLGQNLKWAFLTIHTCIERIEQQKSSIMGDLKCFKNVLVTLLTDLDLVKNEDYKKNKQYYKNTL